MTPSGIELATFRFVAQHLNHFATAVSRTMALGSTQPLTEMSTRSISWG